MSEHHIDVMVAREGNFIIEDGDVHSPDSDETWFTKCWCADGRHRGVESMTPEMFSGVSPHLIGITKYTLYWEVRK